MKYVVFFFLFSLAVQSASAQFFNNSKVPTGVKLHFQQQFPKAKKVNWNVSQLGFEVTFTHHHQKHFGVYNLDGSSVVQTEEMTKAQLPRKIRKQLKREYADYIVEGTERIENQQGFIYSTEIASAEESLSLVFDSDGRLRNITPIDSGFSR